MKLKEKLSGKKRDVIVLLILAVIFAAMLIPMCLRHFRRSPSGYTVSVEADGQEILSTPLSKNGYYLIADGRIVEIGETVTLESLGDAASPSKHDVNILRIQDGEVSMTEANCPDQICVKTSALTVESHDIPIVCLPHGIVVSLKES